MTKRNTRRGFTLIELLVVVLIIGILAAVALPQYQVAVRKAELARLIPLLDAMYKAQQVYFVANGDYADSLEALDLEIPIPTDCTHRRTVGSRDFYICDKFVFGIEDNSSNVQTGLIKGPVLIKQLKRADGIGGLSVPLLPGKEYCWGQKDPIGEKICKSKGGELLQEGTSRFILP